MKFVFDLDGTLADDTHRLPFILEQDPPDWDEYFARCWADLPNIPLINQMRLLWEKEGNSVEIWTGRSAAVMGETNIWLREHDVVHDVLRMRPVGDHRPNTVLKGEWITEYGRPDWAFDDLPHCVDWWRAQGIQCVQVNLRERVEFKDLKEVKR